MHYLFYINYSHFFLTSLQVLFFCFNFAHSLQWSFKSIILTGGYMVYIFVKSHWSVYFRCSRFALCKFLIQFQRIQKKQAWFSSSLIPAPSSSVAKYYALNALPVLCCTSKQALQLYLLLSVTYSVLFTLAFLIFFEYTKLIFVLRSFPSASNTFFLNYCVFSNTTCLQKGLPGCTISNSTWAPPPRSIILHLLSLLSFPSWKRSFLVIIPYFYSFGFYCFLH